MNRQKLLWISWLVAVAVILYLLAPILTPFVLGFIFAYIGNPVVTQMENSGIGRAIAVSLGFCLIILIASLLILLMLPAIHDQFTRLVELMPVYIDRVEASIKSLLNTSTLSSSSASSANADGKEQIVNIAKEAIPQSGTAVAKSVGVIGQSGSMIAKTVMNVLLVPVLTFYLLRDWNRIKIKILQSVPSRYRAKITDVSSKVDVVLRAFLKGQGLVMICLGAMYSVGLIVIGLEFGLLIGVIAGLLSFVPFLGTAAGMLIASVTLVMQTGNWADLWMVAVVFGAGQFIEGNFLTPKLVGDRVDLHPVIVIFAVIAGGHLFGFVGVLLAVPVVAVAWVIVKQLFLGAGEYE